MAKNRLKQCVWCALCGTLAISRAPASAGLRMEEAVQMALQHNPHVQATRQRVAIAEGALQGAGIFQHYPQLEVEGMAGRERQGESVATREWHVALSQEIPLGKQRHWRLARAAAVVTQSHWEVQEAERQLRQETREAFYRLLFLEEKQRLVIQAIALAEQLLHFTQERYRAGDSPQLEVNLASVSLQQARRRLGETATELTPQRIALNRLLGRSATMPLVLEGTLEVTAPTTLDASQARQQALQQRPEVQHSAAVQQEAQSETALIRAQRLPNLEVGLVFQRQETGSAIENAFGGRLSMPLPLWDRQRGALLAAQARQRMAAWQQVAVQQQVEADVLAALARLEQLQMTLSLFADTIVPQSRANLELLQQAYTAGSVGLINVITAQQSFLATLLAHLEARLDYCLGLVRLDSLLGGDATLLSLSQVP